MTIEIDKTNHDKTKDEKLQCDNNLAASKILASLSGKIDKNESLTVEEILPPDHSGTIKQAKFNYSPLETFFQKQIKGNWGSRRTTNKSNWNRGKRIIFKYTFNV